VQCPECGDVLPAIRARVTGEGGPETSFREALEVLWRAAGMTAIVGTCAATSYWPAFTGLCLLGLAGKRAIGWWRMDRDGWLKHPALAHWRPMIRGVTIAELGACALLIVSSVLLGGTRFGPVIVSLVQAVALAIVGLQLVGLLVIVKSLWTRMLLPAAEWFDDLALPAMIAGCIGITQVPLVRAMSLAIQGAAGERLQSLAAVLVVIGLVALVFALFVLVDRASRVSQAAGLLEGLDPPPDLDPDWDGTRRPRPRQAAEVGTAPRVRRHRVDDDPIPLD
jgi:hypothetical protein